MENGKAKSGSNPKGRPRVVVVGSGFAGFTCARPASAPFSTPFSKVNHSPFLSASLGVGAPTSAHTSIKCSLEAALSLSSLSAHFAENCCVSQGVDYRYPVIAGVVDGERSVA